MTGSRGGKPTAPRLPAARAARRSAAFYKATFVLVEKAGHNLMMEHNYRETAETIHGWLVEEGIM